MNMSSSQAVQNLEVVHTLVQTETRKRQRSKRVHSLCTFQPLFVYAINGRDNMPTIRPAFPFSCQPNINSPKSPLKGVCRTDQLNGNDQRPRGDASEEKIKQADASSQMDPGMQRSREGSSAILRGPTIPPLPEAVTCCKERSPRLSPGGQLQAIIVDIDGLLVVMASGCDSDSMGGRLDDRISNISTIESCVPTASPTPCILRLWHTGIHASTSALRSHRLPFRLLSIHSTDGVHNRYAAAPISPHHISSLPTCITIPAP